VHIDIPSVPYLVDLSDRISGAFFVIISAMFGGINGPTYVFPNERSVYFREKAAGMYSSSLYFISKVITQLPINVLAPTLLITPAYWMMRLNDGFPEFLILLLTAMLVSNVGFGLGMALSTAILDVSVVQKLQSLVTLPFMLFGGLFLNSANVPDYVLWLEYLSFIKYAFRITINTILEGDSYFCRQGDLRDVPYVPAGFSAPLRAADNATVANFNGNSGFISVCPITSGDTMLKTLSLSYSENNFTWYWDFLILVLMNIVFLFISWAFLKYRSPKS
jgi:ABC-type multidrug transport system permease subunit